MTRRIFAFMIVGCLFAGKATAQVKAESNVNKDSDQLLYLEKVEKYRKMKITGTVLTVAGSVLLVVGTVTFINAPLTDGSDTSLEEGVIGILAGQACLGAGIPLWIVGANNQRGYTKKLQQLTVRINSSPQARGLTLTYRF